MKFKKLRCYVLYASVSVPATDTQSAGGGRVASCVVRHLSQLAVSEPHRSCVGGDRSPRAIIRCKFDAIRLDSCVSICRRSRVVSSPRALCVNNARSMTCRISEATKNLSSYIRISSNLHEDRPCRTLHIRCCSSRSAK